MSTAHERIDQAKAIETALRQAARQAILRHKRLGESIVIWKDSQIVTVPADEIELSDDESTPQPHEGDGVSTNGAH